MIVVSSDVVFPTILVGALPYNMKCIEATVFGDT